jgi:HEAT repeat protein
LIHRGDPWWEELLQLYAGQTPDASLLLQKLLGQGSEEELREDLFYTNLILAGRCLAARPTVRQISLRQEVTSRLFDLLTTTPYALTREKVANTLVAIGGVEVNTSLLELLSDQDLSIFIRKCSAQALGQLGDRSVVPELLRLLSDQHLDSTVRQRIALAFGELSDRSVIPELIRLLSDQDLSSYVRWSIAHALGKLGDRLAIPDLLKLLSDQRLDLDVFREISIIFEQLAYDEATVKAFAILMQTLTVSAYKNIIHRALWAISLQMRVRVRVADGSAGKQVEIVKW